ncbi:3-oxoacyl-ACP synthase III family protein [Sphingobacterium corticibacterium]|uniref:Ketoacyl-ACP synthase III n=1 Tax=Sphingobacterium corticibacterium TaxID=2484746 RepID=A0A4Q6XNL5_9SPHI|nr:ketoacyl-ACP synthase III [Sphingobacterium corticibacterium]RZF58884.1 ketoacyl-ACP synthase III [Sphingobacterium corticibacterium]
MGSKIRAIEYYLPDNKVTNLDLLSRFSDYDFEKFESKVGIKTRYWASQHETALDLAVKACEKLFLRVDKKIIDYVIYCTQSPEYLLPTTACILQDRLGLSTNIGAIDYNLGCSGFVYGVSLAKALIESGQVENVLLVTAETYSKYLHPEDKSNMAIFGDGASATLIAVSDEDMIGDFLFGTDGSGSNKLIIKNGASKYAFDPNATLLTYGSDNHYTDNHLYMNGPEIFNFTSEYIPKFTGNLLHRNNLSIEKVDYFVFHQANAFMLDFLRKRIKAEKDQFYINLEDGGNTVSNTIPIALKRLLSDIAIDKEYIIAIVGFGVGLSWAGGIIKINNKL